MLGNHRVCCGNQVFPGYSCGSCGTAFSNIAAEVLEVEGAVDVAMGLATGNMGQVVRGLEEEALGDMLGDGFGGGW